MNIASYNKALSSQVKKALDFAFTKEMDPEDEEVFYCNDTDCTKYRVIGKRHLVLVLFTCTDVVHIWNYCKEHLHRHHYSHYKMGLTKKDHSDYLEIVIDDEAISHAMKEYGNKEETGVITGRKKFDTVFEMLSRKMATIKRHFFASPYEMMIDAIAHNEKSKEIRMVPNLSYNLKPQSHERIWIIFNRNQFSVFYGISFDNISEQQLCKIFFSELLDAKKHINNSPSVSIFDREFPRAITDAFPEEKTKKYLFSNGLISLTIFGSLVRKPESMATYLAGFRTYAYYHIQAAKCYLHSRILRKINNIQRDLYHAELDQQHKH